MHTSLIIHLSLAVLVSLYVLCAILAAVFAADDIADVNAGLASNRNSQQVSVTWIFTAL